MGWDEDVAAAFAGPPWDALLPLAGLFYYAGHTVGWWVLVALLAARRRWDLAATLALALVLTDGAAYALKDLVGRARPEGALFAGSSQAFPSGHAARAGAGLAVAFIARTPRAWIAAAAGFLGLTMLLRLVALAHWPTDVLAGALLGLALGALAAWMWRDDVVGLRHRAHAAGLRLRERLQRVRG